MIYLEGTVNQLLELTGWRGSDILYFGDQIYADLADITLFHGWRTGAIINELEVQPLSFDISTLSFMSVTLENHQEDDEA